MVAKNRKCEGGEKRRSLVLVNEKTRRRLILLWSRGNRDSNFRQRVGGRGGPRRAEKKFYLYVSREAKEVVQHISGPLGGYKSLFAMQPFEPSGGCLALRKLMANG
jgi:hypothetical protein